MSLCTHLADVIEALNHALDVQWREYLHIEPVILDSIATNNSNVRERMLQLVEKWLGHDNGTSDLPCTVLQRWPAYGVCIKIGY